MGPEKQATEPTARSPGGGTEALGTSALALMARRHGSYTKPVRLSSGRTWAGAEVEAGPNAGKVRIRTTQKKSCPGGHVPSAGQSLVPASGVTPGCSVQQV